MEQSKYINANYLLLSFFLVITFLFISFHFYISIINYSKYRAMSIDNRILTYDIPPNRGIILSSNGTKLTINKPGFLITVKSEKALNSLLVIFPQLQKYIDKNITYPYTIYNVPVSIYNQLLSSPISGVIPNKTIIRYYPYSYYFAHVIGYTSKVFYEDLQKDPTLKYNDIIGRAGLEKEYDKYLRGKHGTKYVEIDAHGNILSEIPEKSTPKIDGADIVTHLDLRFQKNLYYAVKQVTEKYHIKGGAAIIMDIHTGAVKALVSYPSYDDNLFAQGISEKDYKLLTDNKRLPLFNRATLAQAPPGSTFKTMVAAAALQEKAITTNTIFNATGVITLDGGLPFQDYHKHVYGPLNVEQALMVSSNIFFCKTALRLGINKLDYYLKYFGIGQKTHIDLPYEASGRLPSIENKLKLANSGAYWLDPVWYPEGDTCNSAIGQGITLVTPIQLAVVASTIANKGTVYQPQIAWKIKQGKIVKVIKPKIINKIPVDQKYFDVVQHGMYLSVHGPRRIIPNLTYAPVTVAAKTGTAEFGIKTKDGYLTTHAWVIGFYPYENPKYAFAVFLESGGSSLHASEVMQIFLNKTY